MNPIHPGYARNNDPYLRKRRVRRLLVSLAVLAGLSALGFLAVAGVRALGAGAGRGKPTRAETLELWESGDYASLLAACDSALAVDPLDSFFLTFKGFASFYSGTAVPEAEERLALMDEAIFSLRKALVDPKAPLVPQVRYVLGKAYFHKGQDYYDEALAELEAAVGGGYSPVDAWEYLALAAQATGQTQLSLGYFAEAMSRYPESSELKLAAARASLDSGDLAKAESLALSAAASTEDAYLLERADFLLGEVCRAGGRHDEALARYAAIRERNPESADAWYHEGLVLADKGDAIGARAAWRKAISIDPMHAGARQKLAERS